MRKLLPYLLMMAFAMPMWADGGNPKFKVILFADTDDTIIGDAAAEQLEWLNDWLDQVVSPAIDMPVDPDCSEPFFGYRCSHKNLMQVLDSFSCGHDDIVLFWYLGHGTRSPEDTSKFPQMCLGETYQENFVPLEAVKERIMQFNPRLCVVVADCCNNMDDGIAAKDDLILARRAGGTTVKKSTLDFIESLFGEAEGCFTISASSVSEYSFSFPGRGFFFTNQFIKTSQNMMSEQMIEHQPWQSIMNQVMDYFKDRRYGSAYDLEGSYMHPQYKFEPREHFKKRKRYVYTMDNNLEDALQCVLKDRSGNHNQELLDKYFDKKAVIVRVGKNGSTVLGQSSVDDYLERMMSRDRLIKVSVQAVKKDNTTGKAVRVLVHEIFMDINQ